MAAYAHSHPSLPPEGWHPLAQHLEETARKAAAFAAPFASAEWARLAGLWHDLGKYSADFQEKLRRESANPNVHVEDAEAQSYAAPRHRVDHSTAGALLADCRFGPAGRPLAWVIAGHHAGLADQADLFNSRLPAKANLLGKAREGGLPENLENFERPEWPAFLRDGKRSMEFWIRMLFSSLVDADFIDTESWFATCEPDARGRRDARTRAAPTLEELLDRLHEFFARLASRGSGPVHDLRARTLKACVAAGRDATLSTGHFSLTVPTGGGKTLASLAFGLEHAVKHGLKRVIVVIPYTSIIEQSADAYREALAPTEGTRTVVEHHSSIGPADPRRETLVSRTACENWDAPVIVTTSVQFFESLFANTPSRCRKLHNIVESVVIFDEVQTLPRDLLAPILDALNELTRNYRVSTVLCTATQPALNERSRFPGLTHVREIIPEHEIGKNFDLSRKRVRVTWPHANRLDSAVDWDELATRIASEPRALAIVHLRDDARRLTLALDRISGEASTRHLSALMYPEHRRLVLREIKESKDRPCRVVSTQLVEAGVDIDFPVVFRALAGADSLAQAAGRCNREGHLDSGRLEVFVAPSRPPSDILRQGLDAMKLILREDPDTDLFAPALYRKYFENLYWLGELDRNAIRSDREGFLYSTVATKFQMIPDASTAIVIPISVCGIDTTPCLRALSAVRAGIVHRELLRLLQAYAVTVYSKALNRLEAAGALELLPSPEHCVVRALRRERVDLYDPRLGLLPADPSIPLIA